MKITGFKRGAYIYLNTPEIRKRLELLGYKKYNKYGVENGTCILTYPHYLEDCSNEVFPHYTECTEDYFKNTIDNWCADRVNCGTDIDKFFEIVSKRYE